MTETADRESALDGAAVLYAKEWGSTRYYGDLDADARLRAELSEWCVRERWFTPGAARRPSSCTVCRCAAMSRSPTKCLDGPRAVVRREAFNRLAVQMAVLHRMLA